MKWRLCPCNLGSVDTLACLCSGRDTSDEPVTSYFVSIVKSHIICLVIGHGFFG